MKILVVVAHPDDETLGAGGTILALTNGGHNVSVSVIGSKVQARAVKPSEEKLLEDQKLVLESLGVKRVFNKDFPDNRLNTVPHLELVQYIESIILKTMPDLVITHFQNDLHQDHCIVSKACQVAIKKPQRNLKDHKVKDLWCMEVLSSTNWSIAGESFRPNVFIPLTEKQVDKKCSMMEIYTGVNRPIPHPVNGITIKAQARLRGSQCGYNYAEAFECLFAIVEA